MTDSKTPFRVLRKELCSCVTMQFPKCKLCDAQGFFAVVDWQATADALELALTAEREKVERLEKDAARLDYLDANTRLILRSGKQRIRPLIDAAMKGEVDD